MTAVFTIRKDAIRLFCDGVRFALRAADKSIPLNVVVVRIKKTQEISAIQAFATNRYMLNEFQLHSVKIKAVPATPGDIDATVQISLHDARRIAAYRPSWYLSSIRVSDKEHVRIGPVGKPYDIAASHVDVELPTVDQLESLFPDHEEKLKEAGGKDLSVTYANPKFLREAFLGLREMAPPYEPIKIEVNGEKPMLFSTRLFGDSGSFARSLVIPIRYSDHPEDAP